MEKLLVKSLKSYPVSEDSPFEVEGILMRRYMVRKNQSEVVNTATGEISLQIPINADGLVLTDTMEFRKIYKSSFGEIKNLSIPGLKLLVFIMDRIKKDTTTVVIDLASSMEFCGYSTKKMIYIGISELIERRFIARALGDSNYHINTNYIFNGKRTNLKS